MKKVIIAAALIFSTGVLSAGTIALRNDTTSTKKDIGVADTKKDIGVADTKKDIGVADTKKDIGVAD